MINPKLKNLVLTAMFLSVYMGVGEIVYIVHRRCISHLQANISHRKVYRVAKQHIAFATANISRSPDPKFYQDCFIVKSLLKNAFSW